MKIWYVHDNCSIHYLHTEIVFFFFLSLPLNTFKFLLSSCTVLLQSFVPENTISSWTLRYTRIIQQIWKCTGTCKTWQLECSQTQHQMSLLKVKYCIVNRPCCMIPYNPQLVSNIPLCAHYCLSVVTRAMDGIPQEETLIVFVFVIFLKTDDFLTFWWYYIESVWLKYLEDIFKWIGFTQCKP